MKINAIIATAFAILTGMQSSYSQQTIPGFEAPESVIKSGDKLFVSNIGGATADPMALDSNGFISELSTDGKLIKRKFQKGILNGPKGLAIVKDVVYVADINRVVGFNMHSGEQVFEVDIPAKMLNDLCTVDNNHLCVSETVSGRVLLIDLTNKSIRFLGTITGANGVTYDEKSGKLYAVGMGANMSGGKMFQKDMKSTDTLFTELPASPTGIFDGLEMFDNNHLIASDWISFTSKTGRLIVYDLDNHTTQIYQVDAGPADITYDRSSHMVYIPQMMKNSLYIENMKNLHAQ
jgi:DNA-binding beta-propeller fold protein YncE